MTWSCGSYAELHSPPKAPKALTTARGVPTCAPQAAMGGHSAVAAKLLDYGADAEAADSKGNTALHYAAACGMLLVVEVTPRWHGGETAVTRRLLATAACGFPLVVEV